MQYSAEIIFGFSKGWRLQVFAMHASPRRFSVRNPNENHYKLSSCSHRQLPDASFAEQSSTIGAHTIICLQRYVVAGELYAHQSSMLGKS